MSLSVLKIAISLRCIHNAETLPDERHAAQRCFHTRPVQPNMSSPLCPSGSMKSVAEIRTHAMHVGECVIGIIRCSLSFLSPVVLQTSVHESTVGQRLGALPSIETYFLSRGSCWRELHRTTGARATNTDAVRFLVLVCSLLLLCVFIASLLFNRSSLKGQRGSWLVPCGLTGRVLIAPAWLACLRRSPFSGGSDDGAEGRPKVCRSAGTKPFSGNRR